MMKNYLLVLTCCLLLIISSCGLRSVRKIKGLVYNESVNRKLDLYSPKKPVQIKSPVLIFVHGGNWRSGKRSYYKFVGRGFAKKGVTTAVIDYGLNDEQQVEAMGAEVSRAVLWVKENISRYGGDPSRIFISGHSSGGHLAALVATKDLAAENPRDAIIKGVILIDAFGLDMHQYLLNSTKNSDTLYYKTFTRDRTIWMAASPVMYLKKTTPPFLLFVGGNTYPAIIHDSGQFFRKLKKLRESDTLITVEGKKHIPMIAMFSNGRNRHYPEILKFMGMP